MKINGSLVFDASSASEIQNLRIEKIEGAAVPVYGSADNGRLIYVLSNSTAPLPAPQYKAGTLYFGGGADWVAIATGGNAAELQAEVDRIETSLGGGIGADGSFVASAFNGQGPLTGVTSFTDAITQLAQYADNNNTLGELDDVTLASLADGQYLKYNAGSSKWVNDTLQVADVTDLTASAAELNILDGATLTTTELNYVTGVTSAIQTQLNNKQPLDATLTGVAALAGTGIVVQTVDGATTTFTHRSLFAPASGIAITNADGVDGNPTFALDSELAALEALSSNNGAALDLQNGQYGGAGFILRSIVPDGDGGGGILKSYELGRFQDTANIVVNQPVNLESLYFQFDLTELNPSTQQTRAGDFQKFTVDTYGRITNVADVTLTDIKTIADGEYVNVDGDTMTGTLTMSNLATVTGLASPVKDTDAATKAYVDSLTTGLSWKQAVRAATTADVTLATGLAAGAVIDGVTLATGDRVLVKSQGTASENGIYVVKATGAPDRAPDVDTAAELLGAAIFVRSGTINADTGWVQTAEVATLGTDAVTWVQFSGANAYTWGNGLEISGNQVDVRMGAGITILPDDQVGIDVATGKAVQLTGTGASDQLTFVLHEATAGASGLEQSGDGLRIKASSVTNAMLANKTIAFAGTSGSDAVALGERLTFSSTVANLVSAAVTDNAIALDVRLASTTATGVASFDDGDFSVTSGAVSIKTGGVDNAQLVNSTISFSANSGTADAVALGETVALTGSNTVHTDATAIIKTTVTDNTVSFAARAATASLAGVASFPAADFSITAGGEVSIVQKALTDATDVSDSATPTVGEVLVGVAKAGGGSEWKNRKFYHLHTQASASNSWTVTHNIGQQYCNVTIVDADDEVVIPQSITFNSANQLTVTFNTAITGKVVVMGIA